MSYELTASLVTSTGDLNMLSIMCYSASLFAIVCAVEHKLTK